MRESSIAAEFQFRSYKVDRFEFASKPQVGLLALQEGFSPEQWEVKFRFRRPIYLPKSKTYLGGLDMLVSIPEEGEEPKEGEPSSLVRLDAGIAGVFTVTGRLDKKTEETLVKIQIPALLLPYLRGTISSFLANSGFGAFIFPLINIHAAAEGALKDVEVEIIED
jgi:preprotein translocase subunit SecB